MKGREMDTPIMELSDEQKASLAEQIKGRIVLPTGYLSNTQVEMYLRCPKQYEFRYVMDQIRPPAISMIFGGGTHKALEVTHHHIVDHDVPAPDEMLESAFSDKFEGEVEEKELGDSFEKEGVDKGRLKDEGYRLVRLYNKKIAPRVRPQVTKDAEGKEVRGIEKRFDIDIEGVPVMGFIDLIDVASDTILSPEERQMMLTKGIEVPSDMSTVVADFKTKVKSYSQADADSALQLSLYSLAEGVPFVRYDQLLRQQMPKIKRITSKRGSADHAWLKEVYIHVAKAITAGVFPPTDPTNWVCSKKWCGYWHACRGAKR